MMMLFAIFLFGISTGIMLVELPKVDSGSGSVKRVAIAIVLTIIGIALTLSEKS